MDSKKSIKSKIIAHLDGDLSQDELNGLFIWISKSKENARFYAEIKDLWEASVSDASQFAETEKEWEKFEARVKKQKRHNPANLFISPKIVQRIAAILIVAVLIGSLIIRLIPEKPTYFTAIAPKGSISQMILPDSTIVYLNAGSEIKYAIGKNLRQREVSLNGEAFFEVAKMKAKPFIVHTSSYDVRVLGTKFNVKAYNLDSKIETTLLEGSIMATSSGSFAMAENVTLKPGEQLIFDKENNKILVKKVDTELFTSWKDNKLIFIKMSFDELVVLLERKYGVDIEVEDKDILAYHYSGTIKNETVLELLDIIKHTLPIRYEIEGQTINILKK